MCAQSQSPRPDSFAANAQPIEVLTGNEFSILRLWEIDRVPPPLSGSYHFMVRNSQSEKREIIVEIADPVVVQVEVSTRERIQLGSSFWICCAEKHLANYVWQKDDYPPDDRLCVGQLDPEDLITAIRWALMLKGALLFKPNLIVTSVPYHLKSGNTNGKPKRGPDESG
jgi:hypothetical protein